METGTVVKRYKIYLWLNLLLGLVLLVSGIIVELRDFQILDNNRILIAVSFIPLALAFVYIAKIIQVMKYPEKFAEEYDERLVAARDRADAMSLRVIRYVSSLGFLAYTFARSSEVFESFTWWLIAGLAFAATFLPVMLLGNPNKKAEPENIK